VELCFHSLNKLSWGWCSVKKKKESI